MRAIHRATVLVLVVSSLAALCAMQSKGAQLHRAIYSGTATRYAAAYQNGRCGSSLLWWCINPQAVRTHCLGPYYAPNHGDTEFRCYGRVYEGYRPFFIVIAHRYCWVFSNWDPWGKRVWAQKTCGGPRIP